MIRRILHIFCSLWLALLLLFGATPKELVHAFAHHRDTVHHADGHPFVLEKEHHHCSFLLFQLYPFAADYIQPVISAPGKNGYIIPYIACSPSPVRQAVIFRPLRAPPAA